MSRIASYTKFAIDIVVGAGTAKIVRDVVAKNVEPETTAEKIAVGTASIAIGGAVSSATKSYTDTLVDDVEKLVRTVLNKPETEEN